MLHGVVVKGVYFPILGNTAATPLTGKCLQSGLGAGGLVARSDHALIPVMLQRRDLRIAGRIIAAGAVASCRRSRLGTGGGLLCIVDQIVIQRGNKLRCAHGADLRCGTGSLGPGRVSKCRTFSMAAARTLTGGRHGAGSLRHIVAKGAALRVAAPITSTGGGLGTGGCRHIMGQRRQLHISGIVTAAAGLVSLPAHFPTGRCLTLVLYGIVIQGVDHLVGGVVAAGTGLVGFPATLQTAGRLALVLYGIVAKSVDHLVGGVVAAGTGLVGLPATLKTGGRLALVLHGIVAKSVDHLVGGVVASGTGLVGLPAIFQTGGRLAFVLYGVMVKGIDHLVGGVVATGTGLVGFPALFQTGGRLAFVLHGIVAKGVDHLVGGVVAAGTGFVGFPALFQAGGRLTLVLHGIVVKGSQHRGVRMSAVRTGQCLQTGLGTGGCLRGSPVVCTLHALFGPESIGIGIDTDRAGGLEKCSVGIFQFGGGNGNLRVSRVLDQLIGNGLGAGLDDQLAAARGMYIGAAGGGVNIASTGIHKAVHPYIHIHQIRLGAGIGSAGGIGHRNKCFVAGTRKTAPVICVIGIEADSGVQLTCGIFLHDNLYAGQQGKVLRNGNGVSAADPNCNIAVDGQLVVFGVNGAGANAHADGRHGHRSVGLHDQAIRGSIIAFYNIAIRHVEHTAAFAYKRHCRAKIGIGHINGGVAVFRRSAVEGQGHFDILDIVLGQGEHAVIHVGTLGAAAEVHDLKVFIHRGSVVGNHAAIARDKAIGVQRTAVVHGDIAAALHRYKAHISGGRAAVELAAVGIAVLGRDADGTVDVQFCTRRQRQVTVSGRLGIIIIGYACRLGGKHGVCTIKGNKQGHAGRDRVVPRRQRTVVHQNDCLLRCRRCRRLCRGIQIVKQAGDSHRVVIDLCHPQQAGVLGLLRCTAHTEPGFGVRTHEHGPDRHILCGRQRIGRGRRQNQSILFIDPAKETHTAVCCCHQSRTIAQADLLRGAVLYGRAAHRDRAKRTVIVERNIGLRRRSRQAEVAQRQCGGAVAQTAV